MEHKSGSKIVEELMEIMGRGGQERERGWTSSKEMMYLHEDVSTKPITIYKEQMPINLSINVRKDMFKHQALTKLVFSVS